MYKTNRVWWYAGIMLLEKQLLQIEGNGESSHKRARSSTAPPTQVTTTWIELSKYVCFLLSICKWTYQILTYDDTH